MSRCEDTGELFTRRMSAADIAHHMAFCKRRRDERAERRRAGAKKAAATRERRRVQVQFELFERKT
jgi:hypothetical protein